MKRIAYYGDLNYKLSEELFEKVLVDLKDKKGDKFYYILPNGEVLTRKRQELVSKLDSSFDLNLYTFDNIVSDILSDKEIIEIGENIKKTIIKKTLDDLIKDEKIHYYKESSKQEGFISVLSSIIGDFKRNGLGVEEIVRGLPKDFYYREIGEIYSQYEKILSENNLLDREGVYLKAIEVLKQSEKNILTNKIEYIIIDGFYNFRQIEIDLLEEIVKMDIDIYINFPYKFESRPRIVESTLNLLRNWNFKILEVEADLNDFEALASSLFKTYKCELDLNNISLVKSPNINLEIKDVFKKIKILLNKGVKPSEICIIPLDISYTEKMYLQNRQEKIPINYELKGNCLDFKLVEELLSFLTYLADGFKRDDFVKILKFKYINLFKSTNLERIEIFIRGLEWLTLDDLIDEIDSLRELDLDISFEDIEILRDTLKKHQDLAVSLTKAKSLRVFNDKIERLYLDLKLKERIVGEFKLGLDYKLFKKNVFIINEMYSGMKLLNTYEKLLTDMDLNQYVNLLKDAFKDVSYSLMERNLDGINILDLINSRNLKYDHVFILGLSNDIYPNIDRGNFFLNDTNLKRLNLPSLEKNSYAWKMENERIKLALALVTANKSLYLSYSSGPEGENIRSIFLESLLDKIKGETLEEKLKYEELDVGSFLRLEDEDISNTRDFIGREVYTKKNRLIKYEEQVKKIYLGGDRFISKLDKYNGNLEDQTIRKELNEIFRDRVYSVSFLEKYALCPFRFLLSEILKVDEINKEKESYSRLDLGSLLHESLRVYYGLNKEKIQESHRNFNDFKVDLLELEKIVKEKSYIFDYDLDKVEDRLIIENAIEILFEFIINDINRIFSKKNRFIPVYLEKEFGMKDGFQIGNIRIMGKIDRLDQSLETGKYSVIDYKLSTGGCKSIDDIKNGSSLQIPVYLLTNRKDYNLGIYGSIRGNEFFNVMAIGEENPQIRKSTKADLPRDDFERILDESIEYMEKIILDIKKASFKVEPKDCSRYCIYKNVCRLKEGDEIQWI